MIQLERKHKKYWQPFNSIDEVLLRIITATIEFKLGYEIYANKIYYHKIHEDSMMNMLSSLISARSQIQFLKTFEEITPDFHQFENAGLLFYNYRADKLYTLLDTGSEYCPQTHNLSTKVGIVGEILKDLQTKSNENDISHFFHSEVDSIEGMKRMRNFIFTPLFQDPPHNEKLIGIFKLINKVNNAKVTMEDINLAKNMAGIYGLFIVQVIERHNNLNLLLKIKESSDSINTIMGKKGKISDELWYFDLSNILYKFGSYLDKADSCKLLK